jgi:hypothetical protein
VEIIPPTSLVVPLLGKYLIFAMILVSIRYGKIPFITSLHTPLILSMKCSKVTESVQTVEQ